MIRTSTPIPADWSDSPAYNGPRLDRTESIPGIGTRTIGIGVEQGTALILRQNSIRAIGDGAGHIFLKSHGDRTVTWRTLRAGDDELVIRPIIGGLPRSSPTAAQSDADRNPFGMPEPIERGRWGTVVLHGGNDTTEMIDSYPLLAGVVRPKLVHCPASRESCRPRPDMMGETLMRHLESEFTEWRDLQRNKRIEELTFLTTDDPKDAARVEFTAPLASANGLWFCGGDQRELARLFVDPWKPTHFQREVVEIVRRGGVVGGSSAGLAIMPDVMIEGGAPEEGNPAEASLSRGLGVLRHVLAEQHFDARAGRIERLTGLLRNHQRLANFAPACSPKTLVGIAVEEDTALIIQANRVRVAGTKRAHLFLQDRGPATIVWHALKPGDVAVLRASSDGLHLQPEEWQIAP